MEGSLGAGLASQYREQTAGSALSIQDSGSGILDLGSGKRLGTGNLKIAWSAVFGRFGGLDDPGLEEEEEPLGQTLKNLRMISPILL